ISRTKNNIQKPLRGWIFGEIFHKNINEMLEPSRQEFKRKSKIFKDFSNEIMELLSDYNKILRDSYKIQKEISDNILDPLTKINTREGTFSKAEKYLERMEIHHKGKDAINVLNQIKSPYDPNNEKNRIDLLIGDSKEPFVIKDDEELFIAIDQSLVSKKYDFSEENGRKKLIISKDLFFPKKGNFLGKAFDISIIVNKNGEGVIFNEEEKKIYINIFNPEVQKCTLSYLHVYIAVEIAYKLSKGDTNIMRNKILTILSTNVPPSVSETLKEIANSLLPRG
ncbi:hypothetical protein ACFL50_06555, partial [Candidatus Latescibacterota bacterium]